MRSHLALELAWRKGDTETVCMGCLPSLPPRCSRSCKNLGATGWTLGFSWPCSNVVLAQAALWPELSIALYIDSGPGHFAWDYSSQKVSWSFQHHPCCSTSKYPWRQDITFAKPFLCRRQCPLHSGNSELHIFDLRAQLLQLIISGNGAKQAEKSFTGAKRSSLRAQMPGGCDPSACSSCFFARIPN